jgi:hypothetical protein
MLPLTLIGKSQEHYTNCKNFLDHFLQDPEDLSLKTVNKPEMALKAFLHRKTFSKNVSYSSKIQI